MLRPPRAKTEPSHPRFQVCRVQVAQIGWSLVAFALQSIAVAPVGAASDLSLEWNAPSECPIQPDMLSRVKRSLGDASAQANLSAVVNVTQTSDTYRAEVHTRSREGSGERVVENTSCEILADSVALVIALSAASPQNRGLGIGVSVHGTMLSGPLPSLAWGVGGGVALEGFWALRLELSGSYYAEQSFTYLDTNIGARFELLRFGARGCRLWSFGVFDLAPCVGAQVYRIAAEGFGGMKYYAGTSYLWGPAFGLFSRLRWSFFAVALAADLTIPVSRQRFVYTDLPPLHRPAALAFQLFLAPEVQF